jgi:type IV pilus assembly protein PilC
VTDIVSYRKFYFRLQKEIEVGQSFAAAFESLKESKHLLPASVQQLVITGEKSGKISDMLVRIADIYEKKAEAAAERLPVVLEPMLLLFIGGLVGTIAFAIIVPIYSIVGSVGR